MKKTVTCLKKNVNDIVLMVKYNFTFVLLKSSQITVPPSARPFSFLNIGDTIQYITAVPDQES